MGHNVSRRQQRDRLLASPLAQWHPAQLMLDCGHPLCARGRRYLVRDLSGVYPGLSVGDALRRMRCATCKRTPDKAAMLWPHPDMRRPPRVFMLKGKNVD